MPIEAIQLSEWDVKAILAKYNGNTTKAAQSLGISQAWLSKWLKKNGFIRKIEWVKDQK